MVECRKKLREEFEKNKHVEDIRVIDMLVIKVRLGLTPEIISQSNFSVQFQLNIFAVNIAMIAKAIEMCVAGWKRGCVSNNCVCWFALGHFRVRWN